MPIPKPYPFQSTNPSLPNPFCYRKHRKTEPITDGGSRARTLRLKQCEEEIEPSYHLFVSSSQNATGEDMDYNASTRELEKNKGHKEMNGSDVADNDCDDVVSGFLYDRLQKEVIGLRKYCDLKDGALNSKDEEIKMLTRKIETLTRAIEIESRKMKREAAMREKDSAVMKVDGRTKGTNAFKRSINTA